MRADAVAVPDARILAIGSAAAGLAHQGDGTALGDLARRAPLPGFVDANGNVPGIGLHPLAANLLAAHKGEAIDIASIQRGWGGWAATLPNRIERAAAGLHCLARPALMRADTVLDATVTRRSRASDIIGPDHQEDVITALKAMTILPASLHFEVETKGSIAVGKLAEVMVLSADPTAVDPETPDSLKVMMTIKEDEVVYSAE